MKRLLFYLIGVSLITTSCAVTNISDKNVELIQAAKDGSLTDVQTALADGANPNARDIDGNSVLQWAASRGRMEIVKLLLDRGADVNTKNTDNASALYFAAWNGHKDIVKLLLDGGADVNAKQMDGGTALMIAANKGHTDIVRFLLERGADVNTKDEKYNITALFSAAAGGHADIVELLLDKGADPEVKDKNGNTALSESIRHRQMEVIRILDQMTERAKKGKAMCDRESAEIVLVQEHGIGNRFVLKEIQPGEKDKYGRGAQNATIQYFYRSEKFQPQNLILTCVIGQYFREDEPLLMPGGSVIGTREASSLIAKDGFLETTLAPIALNVPKDALFYYRDGAARIFTSPLSWNPPLDELLPTASGSVHRYIGDTGNDVRFRGVRFNGTSEDDPLTFALLKDIGYIYLHGKGIVTLQDDTKVELGSN